MKKIIIIIFLLITAKGFCQFEPIPKANGNNFSTIQTFNGITNSGANYQKKYRTVSNVTDTATIIDHIIILDASSDTVNAFLPLASNSEGQIIIYIPIDVTNPVTIYANGSDLISGGEVAYLALLDRYGARILVCINGQWCVIAHVKPGDL